ncbi:MAG: hypothetical protein ACYC63_06440 [Armatimonadota bacterium]
MLRLNAAAIVGLLFALVITSCSGQTVAVLQNTGFDETIGAGWTARRSFGPCEFKLDTAVKRSGAGSLRAELGRFGGGTVTQIVPVTEAGPVSFKVWVKTQLEAADGVYLQFAWLNDAGEVVGIGEASGVASGVGDWRALSAMGEKPVEATRAALKIVIGQGKSADGGMVWVDEASLRPGLDVAGAFSNTGADKDADGDGQPDGWRPFIAGGGFVLGRDCGVAHSGQCSAKLQGMAGHGDRSCYTLVSSLCSPAAKLRLRFWYKGTGECTGFLRYVPAPGKSTRDGKEFYDTQSFSVPLPKEEWSEFVFEATTPAAALAEKLVVIHVTIYQRGEGALWLDDVSVEGL